MLTQQGGISHVRFQHIRSCNYYAGLRGFMYRVTIFAWFLPKSSKLTSIYQLGYFVVFIVIIIIINTAVLHSGTGLVC